jgi:hypothetical protein
MSIHPGAARVFYGLRDGSRVVEPATMTIAEAKAYLAAAVERADPEVRFVTVNYRVIENETLYAIRVEFVEFEKTTWRELWVGPAILLGIVLLFAVLFVLVRFTVNTSP